MSQLTLSVDSRVVSRAKTYAKRRGVSVSAKASQDTPPILRSLRGVLKKADLETYKKHLAAKYR